jgi:AraC-like DNA-binding protein
MQTDRERAADSPAFISRQVRAARRFYFNLNPRRAKALTVICGGWEECAADYRIDRATFPYLSIEFVAAGRGALTLGGRTHALEPGTVFSYGPGVRQHIAAVQGAPLVKYFVDFVGDRARRLLRECGLAPGTCVRVAADADVRGAFDTLVRIGCGQHREVARMCALQTELLLLSIVSAGQVGPPRARRAVVTFERCRQRLDTDFLALRTVEDAAAACHVEVSHFCRLFRRFQGESPYRYLQRRRMQWAAERLRDSHRLVREVADELGIDPFQFSRTFKRVHGVSPSAFLDLRA